MAHVISEISFQNLEFKKKCIAYETKPLVSLQICEFFQISIVSLNSNRDFLQQSLTIWTVKVFPANLKTILLS